MPLSSSQLSIASAPRDTKQLLDAFCRPGELTLFGGRPSMGRTSVALNLALALQKQTSKQVLYFDLDCLHSNVERRLRTITGEITEPLALFERNRLSELPLRLWQGVLVDIAALSACCRREVAENPVAAIFIDWIQFLFGRVDDPWDPVKVARTLVELRMMAEQLQVPIIALSMLPRALEEREDKRPRLADFAPMGLPESAGHRFVALYREAYYLRDAPVPAVTGALRPGWEAAELLTWSGDKEKAEVYAVPFHAMSGRVVSGPPSKSNRYG